MESLASAIAIFVLLFPLSNPLGVCDHWPAWQVYAPRTSRAIIQTDPRYSFGSKSIADMYDSGDILGVPAYPEARFQLAVCIAVVEKNNLDNPIVVSGVSDWKTGERISETLTGRDQMKMKASQYFLNTKARPFYFTSTSNE